MTKRGKHTINVQQASCISFLYTVYLTEINTDKRITYIQIHSGSLGSELLLYVDKHKHARKYANTYAHKQERIE